MSGGAGDIPKCVAIAGARRNEFACTGRIRRRAFLPRVLADRRTNVDDIERLVMRVSCRQSDEIGA
jgi:hypothetical protein